MKLFSFLLAISVLSVSANNQSRVLKLQFKENCTRLSPEQKEKIVNEYINIGSGDWLNIQTVSNSKNKAASKLAKQRNRIVASFLISKGLEHSNIIYKYDLLERIWVHKPYHFKSSVVLAKTQKSQCYSFKNSQGITIRCLSGNSIVFSPNSFDVFSDQVINICVEEYRSKLDFVKYGVTAQGDKGMLESQGMFNLRAKCNNTVVKLKRGVRYQLLLQNVKAGDTYYSFYGTDKGGDLSWRKNPNEKFKITTTTETGEDFLEEENISILWESEVTVLSGSFSKLGWINCDRFYNEEEKITMNFKIRSKEEIHVYVVFHNINSVMPAKKIMNGVYTIDGIPKGKNISIVAIYSNDKKGNGELGFVKTVTNSIENIDFSTERMSDVEMTRILDDVIY